MKIKHIFYCLMNQLRFKRIGIKYGENLRVSNSIYLHVAKQSQVTIGNNFTFSSGDGINALARNIKGQISVGEHAKLIIGNSVGISSCCIWVKESVTIGNNVIIGGDSIIIDTDAHNLAWEKRLDKENDYSTSKSKPIVIEDNVMIGTRCIVLKGVTIGARSVIGAGSVVTSSIPSDCIAAGNPCVVIRKF